VIIGSDKAKSLSLRHFFYHKSHMVLLGVEPWPLRWEPGLTDR